MKYVDDIKLGILNNYIYVENINFRESICKPCNELFDAGILMLKHLLFWVILWVK